MTRVRRSGFSIAFVVLAASTAAACSTNTTASPSGSQQRPVAIASTPSAAASPIDPATTAPAQRSKLPGGVYRTQLTVDQLHRFGVDDMGNAGTWTLTVKDGTFQLDCRPIADPGVDCGNHNPSMPPTVEVGTLRGTASTVWFVHDMDRMVQLTGCIRHSQAASGCGPEDAYHYNWKVVPKGISFNHFVGLGDWAGLPELTNFTVQPWTRI